MPTHFPSPKRLTSIWLLLITFFCESVFAEEPSKHLVDFDREIRSILSDHCYRCHGPDKEQRKTDLRLDLRETAFADLGGYRAIVAGDVQASDLYRRISTADPDEKMPPADSKDRLSKEQVELIKAWIEQGADWQEHWSFVAPKRPILPSVKRPDWARSPIDYFVLTRQEQAELQPSVEADKPTLLRRVTLDLTGIQPTPAQLKSFLDDNRPDAYERLVDRLLASPRFGEHMALPWLDAARYADTSGYQSDGPRYMWRWRDWVVQAINGNMPFDQFTIEQIAGDMIPNATLDQRIASGFNRNHRGNSEGGIIPEEYAVEYVVDRVDTTATVWLGLTIGCARCHDHKFDPISQREFYQLFAFFNNVPENGRALKEGNSPPWIKAPTPRQERQLADLKNRMRMAEQSFSALESEIESSQTKWEKSFQEAAPIDWSATRGLVARFQLDKESKRPAGQIEFKQGAPVFESGVVDQAASFDGKRYVAAGDVGKFGYFDKFTLAAWVKAKQETRSPSVERSIVSRVIDAARATGYSVTWKDGHIHVNLIRRWLDDAIRVHTENRIPSGQWQHICVTYDGSRVANGIAVYVNGKLQPLVVDLDAINQSFDSTEPFRIAAGGDPENRFVGLIDDVHVYDYPLSAQDVEILAVPATIHSIVGKKNVNRSDAETNKLRAYYLDQHAAPFLKRAHKDLMEARQAVADFWESIPTVMVMEEMEPPRATFVLNRGQYDQPRAEVRPALPARLPRLPSEAPLNRVGLANWVVDPSNPLTARVTVNRYWQMLFGTGLVATAEDFGSQGQRPSHPKMLDWLAIEFMRSGWDVKWLLREIVTSSTYRQSSKVTPKHLAQDPNNRLISRGSRIRLRAETIRDQALAASGLLVETLGGPSVRPYQPDGLWEEIASVKNYEQSRGAGLYRRSFYTYWKRTVTPPAMMTFDASTRETCIVRTPKTNTPLQALTLMNDVTFVECSRTLAQRVMHEVESIDGRISRMFELLLSRTPRHEELDVLIHGFHDYQSKYQNAKKSALDLLGTGEYPFDDSLDERQWAAYTVVASLIMNLDEFVTKE